MAQKWNIDSICRWLATLEKQRFAKYAESLKSAMLEQGITSGEDLPEIEANDLFTMGLQVHSF